MLWLVPLDGDLFKHKKTKSHLNNANIGIYRCNCSLLLQPLSDFVNTLKGVVIVTMQGPCHPSHSSP